MTDDPTKAVAVEQPTKADALRGLVYELNNLPMVSKGTQFDGWLVSEQTLKSILDALQSTPEQPASEPVAWMCPSLDEVERVEIDRPFMLAAARAWWAVHMGGNVRAINITGDGRVKVAWSDADESGHYTLPVDFLAALSPASATSERERIVAWLREKATDRRTYAAVFASQWADAIERGDAR